MNPELIRLVWTRADYRCEYCHLPQAVHPLPFHVDHIIARQHGGQTVSVNLALVTVQLLGVNEPDLRAVRAVLMMEYSGDWG